MRGPRADLPAPHPGAAASSLRRPAPRPRPPPVRPARSPHRPQPAPAPSLPGGSRGRGGGPRTRARPRPSAPGPCGGGSGGGARGPRALRLTLLWSPGAPARRLPSPQPPLLWNLGRAVGARRQPPAPTAGPPGPHAPALGSPGSLRVPGGWERGQTPKQVFLGLLLSAHPKGRPTFGPSLQPQPSPTRSPVPPGKGPSLLVGNTPCASLPCLGPASTGRGWGGGYAPRPRTPVRI